MNENVCNFFAILKDNTVRKINLSQLITPNIRDVFINSSLLLKNEDTDEILFDGNYAVQEEEILFVNLTLPDNIIESSNNSIGIPQLHLENDTIKCLFWVENNVYYFQNFDKRKLLKNKNVVFYDNNFYNKLNEQAFIIDNYINAIYENGKFYFKNFVNANKIFNLSDFYMEATNEEIEEFSKNDKIDLDLAWVLDNSNTLIRKQITLIQKSNILQSANLKRIKSKAKGFGLEILVENGKIQFPNDKKQCKAILSYLNEQYYIGLITGNKYITNSKKGVTNNNLQLAEV